MKYVIKDIVLRKVAEGQNAGTTFVQFSLVNPDNRFDAPISVTRFERAIVAPYEEYLTLSQQAGTDNFGRPVWAPSLPKDQNNPLPEDLTVLKNAHIATYCFPNGQELVAVDSDGQPIRDKHGNLVTARSVKVVTMDRYDNETGQRDGYCNGWDLEGQGEQIMRRLYRPLSQFTNESSGGIVLPQDAETPLINGATAPAAAAAPAV